VHKTATTPAAALNQTPVPKTQLAAHASAPQPSAAPSRRRRAAPDAPLHGTPAQPALAGELDQADAATPLGDALLRAAHDARDALALEDPVNAIHKTRRALKGARALLMLIEGERRPAARQLRRDLGAVARSLASTRDRHIIHDAIADLTGEKRRKPLDAALARKVASTLTRRTDRHGEADGNLPVLREAGLPEDMTRAAQLADGMETGDLPEALASGYRRARRAACGIDPADAEALHELRKHVVAHVCQMELATPWWPRLATLWLDELQRLRETLGRHHDLEILLTRLDSTPGRLPPDDIATVMDAASRRQRKLAGQALQRHARLFAERPKAFRKRLAAYLEAYVDHAENRE
jgi:CHAD domain-containing protein